MTLARRSFPSVMQALPLPRRRVEFVRDAAAGVQRFNQRRALEEDNRFLTDVIFHRLSLLIIHFKQTVERRARTHVNRPQRRAHTHTRGPIIIIIISMTTVMKREKNNESNGRAYGWTRSLDHE